ncbi:MAG: hypothetical protein K2K79_04405 [Paramuribaculum sp.]|nr:hypothetical protein [Paramuribaculum sp.]
MIRLNCFLEISDSSFKHKAIDAAVELVELSLHDEGCIAYAGSSTPLPLPPHSLV